jgi:MFS family permease
MANVGGRAVRTAPKTTRRIRVTADRPASQAWLVWGTAVVVYMAAVFHRGSLGVAGPQALDRFGVGPAALGAFTVLQVGIYAAMQIPTGVLVDRFGSRRVLVLSATLLGVGQLLFALTGSYPLALLARGILGVGDGMTWVTILRLVALRFSVRQYALVATFSSALGGVGGVLATFPLAGLLSTLGWSPTFFLVGAVTLGYGVVAAMIIRDPAPGHLSAGQHAARDTGVLERVRAAWSKPGTRLAFWVHFGTMFVPGALSLIWGYPYLVDGLGMEKSAASVVLSVLILGQVVGGPVVGALIGRSPSTRMPIVAGYLLASGLTWVVLLGWTGGKPPTVVVVVAFAIFALGGPVSAVAFALARDYNPVQHVGIASGLANTGGHSATALGAVAIGLVLQASPASSQADSYRLAMSALVLMLLFGSFRIIVWWRRVRAAVLAAQARGEEVPVLVRYRRRIDTTESATASEAR